MQSGIKTCILAFTTNPPPPIVGELSKRHEIAVPIHVLCCLPDSAVGIQGRLAHIVSSFSHYLPLQILNNMTTCLLHVTSREFLYVYIPLLLVFSITCCSLRHLPSLTPSGSVRPYRLMMCSPTLLQ